MIVFTINGDSGPGYRLIATLGEPMAHPPGALVDARDRQPALFSEALTDPRTTALQARELADAAAALIESLPEYEAAFEHLHDALDKLPAEGSST